MHRKLCTNSCCSEVVSQCLQLWLSRDSKSKQPNSLARTPIDWRGALRTACAEGRNSMALGKSSHWGCSGAPMEVHSEKYKSNAVEVVVEHFPRLAPTQSSPARPTRRRLPETKARALACCAKKSRRRLPACLLGVACPRQQHSYRAFYQQ